MAMVKEEHENLLKEIAASGGDTPKMLELLQKLRDDFDEREGMLKRDGEKKDKDIPAGERKEDEKIRKESEEDNVRDGGERRKAYDSTAWEEDKDMHRRGKEISRDMVSRADYEALRQKYIERFFTSPKEVIRDQKEDIRKDDGVSGLTFEDLFKEREG